MKSLIAFLESKENKKNQELYDYAFEILFFSNIVNIWHWTADNGYQHERFEKIYEILREFSDSIVELLLIDSSFSLSVEEFVITKKEINSNLSKRIEILEKQLKVMELFKKNYLERISIDSVFSNTIESLEKEISLLKNFS